MRKDVILGMTIGGVMLAVVIFYFALSSNSKHDKQGVEISAVDAGGAGDTPGQSGDGSAETPAKPSQGGSPRPSDSSGSATGKPTFLSATSTEKFDPIWGKHLWPNSVVTVTPDVNGADPQNTNTAVGEAGAPREKLAGDGSSNDKSPAEVPGGANKPGNVEAPVAIDPVPFSTPKRNVHKIQKGETLSTIAAAAYGSPNLYPYILRANPKLDPTRLKPGTEITLPDVSEVKGPEKAADKNAEKSSDAGTISQKVEPTIDAKTEYRVQAGDSLHKIAVKLYGKVGMVERIYDLNKAAIGDNPAKLKLGMILKLPAVPTSN